MKAQTPGYVSDELYAQVTDSFPIVCIDVIPFDASNSKIGVITRAMGNETGKLALIGGRIQKNESIESAIHRHLKNDLNIHSFAFQNGNTTTHPFHVQQYVHGGRPIEEFTGYDPTKHSIGLTFIITITDIPKPLAEAADFVWIAEEDIPESTAFNQGVVMHEAFNFIKSE